MPLLLLLPGGAFAQAPPDLRPPTYQMLLAAKDVAGLSPDVACCVRYLDLGDVPADERLEKFLVQCGHLQHLSKSPNIVLPALVEGSKGTLLRVDVARMGKAFADAWEQLAGVDPYYHSLEKVQESYYWQGGNGENGKYYPAGTYYRTVEKVTHAPWLVPTPEHKAALELLVTKTKSAAPIIKARWFHNQTSAQQNRKPGYYDFLGVKDQAGFEKLVGFDLKLHDQFTIEARDSVAFSGVTLQPRAIARYQALGGGFWKSFDFDKLVAGKNALEVLGRDIEKLFVATEQIAFGANGFPRYLLADNKGKVQDVAPGFIANKPAAKGNDAQIHVCTDCRGCHFEGALKPLDGWAESLQKTLDLFPGKKDVREQYVKNLNAYMEQDRLVYEKACKEATGWTVKEYAAKDTAQWYEYENARVDLAFVELTMGISRDRFKDAVTKSIAIGKADLILAALASGKEIPIRLWEQKYAAAWEVVVSFP